jgi:hypothetical protein
LAYGIGEKFHISFWAKTGDNQTSGDNHARPVTVSIVADSIQGAQSTDYISKDTVVIDQVWRKYDITLTSNKASSTTRTLEFQIGNSDTPVHLSGVSFSRVALLMELLPEGISSTSNAASYWYDSSGNDKHWTIVFAQDTGKYQAPNYGYKSCNTGGFSSTFGYYSVAAGGGSVAIGNTACAKCTSSIAFGHSSCSEGISASAIGYGSIALGHFSLAVGMGNTTSDTSVHGTAVGRCNTVSNHCATAVGYKNIASGLKSTALGLCAVSRVGCTTNIGGALITKKDSGDSAETAATSFYQYSSAEITLMTKNIDLTVTTNNPHDITIPTGSTFYISEMGVIFTSSSNSGTLPTISIGNQDSLTSQLDTRILGSNMSTAGAGKRERYIPANPDIGNTSLRVNISSVSTYSTLTGRFYFKGMLIENQ